MRKNLILLGFMVLSVPSAMAQAASHAPTQAAAPAYAVPRNAFGHPDIGGVWNANFILPIEASPQAPMLTLPEGPAKAMAEAIVTAMTKSPMFALDPETPEQMRRAEGLAIVRGERRTRAVVVPADGKIPYTETGRRLANGNGGGDRGMDNPEERPNWERCIALFGQPPVAGTFEANPRRIVQTRDHVVIHSEYGSELRIAPFSATHRSKEFHGALGDSIARWDGDTLVVETIGLPEKDTVRLFPRLVVPATAKVIERFTRLSDRELLYQFTIEDPSVYSGPWLAEYSLYRTGTPLFEFACHEGNYSMTNIMTARRIEEAKKRAP